MEPRRLSCSQLLTAEEKILSFFLRATTDTLPSLTNQALWKMIEDPTCPLCKEGAASLRHVLSSCRTALKEHRYTWRHNKVLKVISRSLQESIVANQARVPGKKRTLIRFCKEGEKACNPRYPRDHGLLNEAKDWTVQDDLDRRLVFPQDICSTSLRPDILVSSEESKVIILIELTVPWEDRIEEAHELKMTKYDPLVSEARKKNWAAYCFAVEVGCRGFPGKSLSWMLKKTGIPSAKRKKIIINIAEEATRCSRWIWLQRSSTWLPQ